MKNFYFFSILFLLFSCQQEKINNSKEQRIPINNALPVQISPPVITQIRFDYYKFDVGEVEEGTVIEYEFPFTNVGNEVLIISNCKSSCGCVVPECPKEPIEPGRSGIFKAQFDTTGKSGKQSKSLTMTANTKPHNTVLTLYATLIPKDK